MGWRGHPKVIRFSQVSHQGQTKSDRLDRLTIRFKIKLPAEDKTLRRTQRRNEEANYTEASSKALVI